MAPPATDETGQDLVHVIISLHTHDGPDGRPETDEELVEYEGWFASLEEAETRAAALNHRLLDLHRQSEDRRRREHAALEQTYRQELKEIEILIAAGVPKTKPRPIKPYEPQSFDRFAAGLASSTSYEVRSVPRSEHDVPKRSPSSSGG